MVKEINVWEGAQKKKVIPGRWLVVDIQKKRDRPTKAVAYRISHIAY